jgi:hypothetical protein
LVTSRWIRDIAVLLAGNGLIVNANSASLSYHFE